MSCSCQHVKMWYAIIIVNKRKIISANLIGQWIGILNSNWSDQFSPFSKEPIDRAILTGCLLVWPLLCLLWDWGKLKVNQLKMTANHWSNYLSILWHRCLRHDGDVTKVTSVLWVRASPWQGRPVKVTTFYDTLWHYILFHDTKRFVINRILFFQTINSSIHLLQRLANQITL